MKDSIESYIQVLKLWLNDQGFGVMAFQHPHFPKISLNIFKLDYRNGQEPAKCEIVDIYLDREPEESDTIKIKAAVRRLKNHYAAKGYAV